MNKNDKALTRSYISLRKTIGYIGIILPIILLIGGLLQDNIIQASISSYYHTGMRNVFVGSLCVVAFFLFFYSGYDKIDNVAGNISCILALGTAFFPTQDCPKSDIYSNIHLISAALLFIIFSFFSICLFTRSDRHKSLNPFTKSFKTLLNKNKQKKRRNIVYIICGLIIILSIIFAALSVIFIDCATRNQTSLLFYIESLMLLSFGISWLTKGGSFLFPDRHRNYIDLKLIKGKKRREKFKLLLS